MSHVINRLLEYVPITSGKEISLHYIMHPCWVYMTTVLTSRNLCKHYYCQRPKDDLLYWQNDAALTCDSTTDYIFRLSIPHIQSSYESSFLKAL